jgi:phosphatidate phosphatase LPIN
MRELVDHYFPPVGLLVKEGGEEYTDFNYWRNRPLDIDEFSASESGSDYDDEEEEEDEYDRDGRPSIGDSIRSEGQYEDMEASFYSRASLESAIPGQEESMDPSLDSSLVMESEDEMVSFPPETPMSERKAQLSGFDEESGGFGFARRGTEETEVEVEDPSGELGALDLAAEATPHVHPVDGPGLLGEGLEELSRVVSSPERVSTGRAVDK